MPVLSTLGAAIANVYGFTSGLIKDQYFNLVSLLLPGNGTNGAQNNTFLDSGTANSGSGFTITRNGNTTQGTFSPFSQTGWGNYFNGSSSILETSTSIFGTWSTANASTTTATIEAMVYVNALQSAPANAYLNPSIIAKGNTYLNFSVNSTGNIVLFHYDGSFRYITSSGTIQANTWNYVAVTITGGTATIYINGTSSGSGTWYGIQTGGLVAPTYIGQTPAGQYWNGYISNLRVSSTVRTIATPLVPYTNDGNTSLLTCQSNRFRDASTNGYTITASGSPSVTPFSPFAPTQSYSAAAVGGSGYFDGTGDYLSIADNAAFSYGTGDFTVEFWMYPTTTGATKRLYFHQTTSTTQFSITQLTANTINVFANNSSTTIIDITGSTAVSANTWTHVAVVRSGNTFTLYQNGTSVASGTSSASMPDPTGSLYIGALDTGSDPYTGYLSSYRIVKGTAITPPSGGPTAPLTAVSGTSLLLNFTNAGVVDATAKNVLETVGNAQISTTQSKWGGGSIRFDGTGDAARIPDDEKENLRFGTGNFTIEFWAWKSANGSMDYDTVISIGSTGSYNGGFSVELSASRGFCFIYDNAVRIQSNFNPNDSTWNHYAVVRDGSTFALYKNGSRLTTATLTPTLGITGTAYVGAGALTDNSFNGYIDDLRVSKGLARYTGSTYTVPTAPFPVQ